MSSRDLEWFLASMDVKKHSTQCNEDLPSKSPEPHVSAKKPLVKAQSGKSSLVKSSAHHWGNGVFGQALFIPNVVCFSDK
jgi:hypothetical protein